MKNHSATLLTFICFCAMNVYAQKSSSEIERDLLLRVEFPTTAEILSNGYSLDVDGYVNIIIKFSTCVNAYTVIPKQTLILAFPNNQNANAILSWKDNDKTLVIRTKETLEKLKGQSNNQTFTLTLKGTTADLTSSRQAQTAPGGIRASSGQFLDGNNDGKPGGDFVVRYKL